MKGLLKATLIFSIMIKFFSSATYMATPGYNFNPTCDEPTTTTLSTTTVSVSTTSEPLPAYASSCNITVDRNSAQKQPIICKNEKRYFLVTHSSVGSFPSIFISKITMSLLFSLTLILFPFLVSADYFESDTFKFPNSCDPPTSTTTTLSVSTATEPLPAYASSCNITLDALFAQKLPLICQNELRNLVVTHNSNCPAALSVYDAFETGKLGSWMEEALFLYPTCDEPRSIGDIWKRQLFEIVKFYVLW